MTKENKEREKARALQKACREIFGRNNLIGTDFDDAKALRVERPFLQDSRGGVLLQFTISNHALGKIMTKELHDALNVLLDGTGEKESGG